MTQALAPFRPFDTTQDHVVFWEPWPRRVRAIFGGETVADSTRVMLLHESMHLPVYYFPLEDVRTELLEESEHTTECPYKGTAAYWTIRVGDRVAEDAVWSYPHPLPGALDLGGYVAFYWDSIDAWYEEDDEVFVHPRDPYHRVDVLHSSRHVRVVVDGTTVAETTRPRLLFETGLPTRYYIPKLDVRMELLTPTDKTTRCPYKGVASYWSVTVDGETHENLVWSYPAPVPECPKIENHLCFFDEHVDVYVDGTLQERPRTLWS